MNLQQGETYSFNTIADEVLGEFTNVTLIAEGDVIITKVTEIDVMNLGDRVAAVAGPSSIAMKDKRFFIFKAPATGELFVVAEDWIVESTIRQTNGNTYIVRLHNMPSDNVSYLTQALKALLPQGVTMSISSV